MLTKQGIQRVCAAARAYKGTPWRGQGRDRLGIDCTGFIVMSFKDAGFEVDEGTPDYRGVDSKRLIATLLKYCDRLPVGGAPMPGDVVVYGLPREAHTAIIVDGAPLNAIHCPMGRAVVETRFDPYRGDIRGFYRWRS